MLKASLGLISDPAVLAEVLGGVETAQRLGETKDCEDQSYALFPVSLRRYSRKKSRRNLICTSGWSFSEEDFDVVFLQWPVYMVLTLPLDTFLVTVY